MNDLPRRFRWRTRDGVHPTGRETEWCYGAYFPQTDLCVTDMGVRSTGEPKDVEWIDTEV